MKVSFTVTLDILFDTESDGTEHPESEIDTSDVVMAATKVLYTDIVTESIVEAITEDTGWCIRGLSLSTNA